MMSRQQKISRQASIPPRMYWAIQAVSVRKTPNCLVVVLTAWALRRIPSTMVTAPLLLARRKLRKASRWWKNQSRDSNISPAASCCSCSSRFATGPRSFLIRNRVPGISTRGPPRAPRATESPASAPASDVMARPIIHTRERNILQEPSKTSNIFIHASCTITETSWMVVSFHSDDRISIKSACCTRHKDAYLKAHCLRSV
mmetsp:Transcript_28175/g.68123  ORF Transcript_28175/g.68123 Transcript_28175/m.68123 type:complete len:201 (+) Transcript_28175:267-869(+)